MFLKEDCDKNHSFRTRVETFAKLFNFSQSHFIQKLQEKLKNDEIHSLIGLNRHFFPMISEIKGLD